MTSSRFMTAKTLRFTRLLIAGALLLGLVGLQTVHAGLDFWLTRAPVVRPIDSCQVIVTGTVRGERTGDETEGLAFGREIKGRWHIVEVAVDDAIKGIDLETSTISARFFLPFQPPRGMYSALHPFQLNARYLIFLQPAPDSNEYDLLQGGDEGGAPPLRLAPVLPGKQDGVAPLDRLIPQLIATAQEENITIAAGAIAALGYLANWRGDKRGVPVLKELAAKGQPEVAVRAMRSLTWGRDKDRSLLPLFEELSNKDDPSLSGEAIAARLRLGDTRALHQAVQWGEASGLARRQIESISGAMKACCRNASREEDVLEALQAVMRSQVVEFRRAASRVFRDELADKELLPTLIDLLDDPDREVQYNAIMGLYEAAEGWCNTLVRGYVPARATFLEAPLRYVTQWKLWWQEGAKFEPYRDEYGNEIPTVRL